MQLQRFLRPFTIIRLSLLSWQCLASCTRLWVCTVILCMVEVILFCATSGIKHRSCLDRVYQGAFLYSMIDFHTHLLPPLLALVTMDFTLMLMDFMIKLCHFFSCGSKDSDCNVRKVLRGIVGAIV